LFTGRKGIDVLRTTAPLALSLAALLVPAFAFAQRGPATGRSGWMSDLRSAKEQARKDGKPLLVMLRCEP
jgi:hypothetical protein